MHLLIVTLDMVAELHYCHLTVHAMPIVLFSQFLPVHVGRPALTGLTTACKHAKRLEMPKFRSLEGVLSISL